MSHLSLPARRRLRSPGAVLALVAGSLLLAGPAAAHVTVNPGEATAGGFSKLTFRVPNESDTAGTTQVGVSFPQDHPLAFVSVKPHPGWDVEVTETALDSPVDTGDLELTEAVSVITWTAQPGVRIGPGEFEEFDVSVGPLPDHVDTLAFPAVQTYDDGEVVSWDQPVVEGQEEPELPAPTLALTSAEDADAVQASTTSDATGAGSAAGTTSSDGTARALGAGGLAVGVLGLVAAAVAIRTARLNTVR